MEFRNISKIKSEFVPFSLKIVKMLYFSLPWYSSDSGIEDNLTHLRLCTVLTQKANHF